MTLENIKEKLQDYFISNNDIIAAYIFGSYFTEYKRTDSDMDFAIYFEKELTLLEISSIEAAISILLNFEKIDVLQLNDSPIKIRFKAISQGNLIYEKDSDKLSNFLEQAFDFYQDYSIKLEDFYRTYDKALKERYINGRH